MRTIAVAGLFIAAAALFFSEHRVHALGYLPYLLLIACPLLHLMHSGHGDHRHGGKRSGHEEHGGDNR